MTIDELFREWFKNPGHLRFGQFVCGRLNLTSPTIFYEEDCHVAYNLLCELENDGLLVPMPANNNCKHEISTLLSRTKSGYNQYRCEDCKAIWHVKSEI